MPSGVASRGSGKRTIIAGAMIVKAKGKRQKAKGKKWKTESRTPPSSPLPFALCLLPFAFCFFSFSRLVVGNYATRPSSRCVMRKYTKEKGKHKTGNECSADTDA